LRRSAFIASAACAASLSLARVLKLLVFAYR